MGAPADIPRVDRPGPGRAVPRAGRRLVAVGIGAVLAVAVAALLAGSRAWFGPLSGGRPAGGGASVLAITPAAAAGRPLTAADVEAITRTVPGVSLLSRVVLATDSVNSGTRRLEMSVEAVDPTFARMPAATLAGGGFFTATDALGAGRVAVLDGRAAEGLFGGARSSLGQTVRIGDVPFTVVGVLASQNTTPGEASDGAVLVPFQTGQIRLFGVRPLGEVLLQVEDSRQTDAVAEQIRQVLRTRHQVPAGAADGFSIERSEGLGASAATPVTQILEWLASLSRQYACQAKTLCGPPQAA